MYFLSLAEFLVKLKSIIDKRAEFISVAEGSGSGEILIEKLQDRFDFQLKKKDQ